MMDRRTLLIGSAAWGLASAAASAGSEATMVFGPQAPFSFDTLTGKARELVKRPSKTRYFRFRSAGGDRFRRLSGVQVPS